jgi:hypothetical protein
MHQFKNAFRNNLLYVNGIDFDLQTDRWNVQRHVALWSETASVGWTLNPAI